MSPDHITAGAYNRHIDKQLAHQLFGYVRLAGWLADKIQVNFENLKFAVD